MFKSVWSANVTDLCGVTLMTPTPSVMYAPSKGDMKETGKVFFTDKRNALRANGTSKTTQTIDASMGNQNN